MEKLSVSLTEVTYVSCTAKSMNIAKQSYVGESLF